MADSVWHDVTQETKYFVDFMRDAPEPTGEEDGDGESELSKVGLLYARLICF